MGEVIDIDEKIQEKGMEELLDYLQREIDTLRYQADMIEMMIKGLR